MSAPTAGGDVDFGGSRSSSSHDDPPNRPDDPSPIGRASEEPGLEGRLLLDANAPRRSRENEARFDALSDYRTSARFSHAERAALDYVTELTRDKSVSGATFAELARHDGEREIYDIVWLVANEHLFDLNIGLNIGSDGFCDMLAKP